MKSQKECVFAVITEMFGFSGGKFSPSKEQLKEIYEVVTAEIVAGNVNFSDEAKLKYPTPEAIRKEYVPGMVSNWIRKDVRLNGGEKYVTKNPGSRAGQGDEVLKNLRALKSTLTEAEHIAAVDAEIESRMAELAKSKAKQVTVDYDKIPAELRATLGLN